MQQTHEKFYYEKLNEVRYQDAYHRALCYCLGISDDTRRNINSIYDFKTGCVKTECLHAVGLMNACKAQAEEIVKYELIYA